MKRFGFMLGALGVLLSLAMACSGGGSNQAQDETTTTEENVGDAMEDAAETSGASLEDAELEFGSAVKAKLTDIQAGIDDLKAKASEYGDDAVQEANQVLQGLSEKRQAIEGDLEGLKDESGEAMEQMRSAIETAVAELERAYQDARAQLE